MHIRHSNIYLLFIIPILFFAGSCNVNKYLTEDQYLVTKNKVIIDDKEFSRKQNDLEYNLESFIIQKPNRDYFFIPREWLYFRNKAKFETPGQKKGWVARAERPVIHKDVKMFNTAEQMEKYLRFSKGYYNAKVYPQAFLNNKRAEVQYHVTTEQGYKVANKEYFGEDERAMQIIMDNEDATLIKPGVPIDETIFDAEKTRITSLFQELGFAKFSKNNIDFKADSSQLSMDVFITILPPPNDSIHRVYTIGDISVYPDYKGIIEDEYDNKIIQNGITYNFGSEKFFVKPNTLSRTIQFEKGNIFRKSKLDDTYTALANLGTYRFINISSDVSATADTVIDYRIVLTPITDPWAIDGSIDVFYSYFLNTQSRIGLGANSSLNNINAFGGGEKFRIAIEVLGENILDNIQFNSFAVNTETGLTYPTIIDPVGHMRLAKATTLIKPKLYNKLKNNSISDASLSYSYISQFQQFITHSINGEYLYEYDPESKIKWIWTLMNINSLSTTIDPIFQTTVLDDNTFIERSFDPRFITGFLLQQVEYRVNNPVFSNGFTWSGNARFEQSGGEIYGANLLTNFLTGGTEEWVIGLGSGREFEFSKYLLTDIDVRATQILSGKHSISGRLRGGIATPYGQNAIVPYIRQFFVGGGNSLRGWNTRELGPGAYSETFLNANATQFFQTGDVVLEASLEYRFPLYYVFEGAAFIDAGNVWTLNEDVDRPGSQFLWNEFYNQIAMNYGIGIRINLDFLVIRFDFGQKLRYPFRYEEIDFKYWEIPKFNLDYLRQTNFVVGLNYPF